MSVPYFNYSFDSETASLNVITNDIVSHDIPVTDGLYMRFEGKNYDEKTKTWYDSGGSGRHIPASSITGTPYLSIQGNASNGTFLRSFQVLKGGTTETINIGNPRLEQYTFFHIARYGGTNQGRIFTTTGTPNWYSGFHSGRTGVAYHEGDVTTYIYVHGTDFFIGCDCSNSYRSNGIDRGTTITATVTYLPAITVNGYPSEKSDFEIADIIIYNRYLSLDERIQMENYLASIYGITNAQNLLPVTTNLYARYEAKNYIPSAKIWYDSGSTRHITSGITGTPTLVTQGRNSNGATNIPFMVVKGGTGDVIPLGNALLTNYTFFFIARYNGGAKGRIFTSGTPNWLSGFHNSKAGVAYHEPTWITQSSSDVYGTNFFISCDCQNSYRANGVELALNTSTYTSLPVITINDWPGELSDWEIADIIIYNSVLSLADRIRVENYLASIYGIAISTVDTTNYLSQLVKLPPCRLGTNGVSFACWFRSLNPKTVGTYPRIFDFGISSSKVALYIDGATGKLGLFIPDLFTNVSPNVIVLTDGPTVLDNTWRHVAWTISPDGTQKVYINGTLIYTNANFFYPQNYDFTSNLIGMSNNGDVAFNGAIDDFKFYKSTLTADEIYNLYDHNNTYPTITPTTTIPTPYLYYNFDPSDSMPGNLGTYLLNKGTPNQPVIPNTTFVRTNRWTTIENVPIIWTASGSSFMPSTTAIGGKTTNYEPFRAFDGSSNGGWVTAANTYNLQTSTIGDYKGNPATSTTTIINSVSTTINGEWIQIQSTVPVKMTSYKFESYYDNSNALACALPQTYYILGSNNGTTWDPIQYVVNNYASTNDASSNVNYTETFTITNNTAAVVSGNYNTKGFETIQGFSTSLNYYTYFRLCVNKVFGKRLGYTNIASTITNDFLAIGEWNIQFLPQYYYDAVLGSSGLIQQSDYRIPNNQVMTNAKADQYIRLPTFSTDISGLTFTCWFRSNNNRTWARLFDFANSLLNDSNNDINLFINNSYIGNGIKQYAYDNQNTNIVPEINDNIWRHVAWTINTNGISTLYINGQSVFSQKALYPFPISRTTNFLLKSNWNDPSYDGAIDEFAMYKTVLSDAAINTIYDSTKSIFYMYNDGSNNQIASTYVATPDLYYTFDTDTVRDQYLANKATGIYDTLMTKDTIIDSTDYKIGNGSIALNGLPDAYVQLPKLSATGIDGLTFACWFRSNGNYDNTPIFDFGNGLVSDNISAKINRNNLTLSVNNVAISPFIYNPYFHYKFDASDTNNYRLKNYGGGATDISGQYDAFIGVGASTIVDYATTKTFDISPNSLDANVNKTWITKSNNNAFAVQWDVSASSIYAVVDYNDYHAFDTKIAGTQGWVSNNTTLGYAATTGNVITNTYGIGTQWNTVISGLVENSISIVNLSGEWLEIKSSVPCSMKTYNLVSRSWPVELPRTYYIFGSNDRITWYPIHYVSRTGGSGTSGYNNGIYTTPTYTIDTNSATQTNTTSGVTSTFNGYSTSLNTYEYFRILVRAIGGNTTNQFTSMCEWNINFTASTTVAPPSINTILSTQNTQAESLILTGADNQKITLPAFTSGQDGLTFSFWMRSDSNTNTKTGAKIMDLGNDSKTDNITMSIQNDSLCCDVYNNGISSSVNSVLRLKPVFYYNFDDNTVNSTTVANLANGKLMQYGNSFSNPVENHNVYPMLANLYNGATVKGKVLTLSRTSATNSSSQFMKLPTMYLDSTKGLTMGCWFRTTDLSGIYPRILTLGADSGTTNNIGFGMTTNRKLTVFSQDTAFRDWNPCIAFPINDGIWRHFMWTINGGASATTGATWKVYINGVFISKNTLYYPTTTTRRYNYVGRSNNSVDSTFDGQISEVFVANTELKAEEVYGLYSNNSSFFYGLNDNNWRHYAWTIANNSLYNTPSNVKISNTYNSMTMSTWKLYVNGVLTTTLSNMNFPNNISRISNYICGSNTATDPSFNGALDDFRMYKSVLSDADIESIYKNPSFSNMTTTSTMKNDNIVSNINDNKWRHMTWSIDTSANWKVYINGDLYSKFKGVYPNNIERYLNFFGKLSKNPDIIDSSYSTFKPNTTAATTNTWTNNGITWTSSASSFWTATPIHNPFKAFNTSTTDGNDAWHIENNTSYDGWDGLYNRTTYSTNVVSYGLIYGEWLQIQSSIPLVMNSYILTSRYGGFSQMPRQYYIVGSNDQSNWYPIQFVMRTFDGGTPANAVSTSTFFVNTGYYSDSNTSNGTISSFVYGYPTSINTYTYFRIIVTYGSANSGPDTRATGGDRYVAIGEWNITFANAVSKNFAGALDDFRMYKRVLNDTEVAKMATINPLYFHYRFDQSDVNSQSLANMATGSPIYDASLSTTGLINTTDFKTGNASLALTTDEQEYPPAPITADTTFIYTGSYGQGRYDVTYSSQFNTTESANKVFSKAPVNTWAGNQWAAASSSYASLSSIYSTNGALGHTGTYNTVVSGISISGEWIQLKMPNAIVLNKYMIIGETGRSINSFVLAGSNDGNTWTLIDEQRNLGLWSLSYPNCTMYFTPSFVPPSYNHFRLIPTSIVPTSISVTSNDATIRQIKYFAKPEQYVTLPSFWSGYNGLSFSMWFKLNGVSNKNPYFTSLFEFAESNAGISGGNNSIYADIDGNILFFSIFKGSAQSILGLDLSMNDNVWRHMAWTVDTNGFWKIYINGRLAKASSKSYPNNIQRYTNYLGRGIQYNTSYNLNGGLDDFRMYKSVLTDQEVMALYKESNKLLIHYTFDKETVNGSSVGDMVGTPAQLSIANGLDFKNTIISPNSANATTANMNGWTTTHDNKVYNWQASASSTWSDGQWLPNNAFDAGLTNMFHTNEVIVGTKNSYTSATGIYAGDNKTNIQLIGNIGGEWLQINCDVPIVMSSYYLAGRDTVPSQFVRSHYIVGSNDGINWYPLQYSTRTGSISGSGNTGAMWTYTTVVATGSRTSPIINMTPYSYDIIPGNGSSTLVFKMTGYSYANNPYTMFRMIFTETVAEIYMSLAEWYIYAYEPLPSQPIYGSELTPTTYYANSNVETGIWANDGVNWTSSNSSQSITLNTNNTHTYTYYNTKVFNGRIGTGTNIYNGWLSQHYKYATSNVAVNTYTGTYNTYVQTVGTVSGDYLQINSNIPVQMSNYYFTSLIEAANQNLTRYLPQEYYIVGSLDGSSQWFPIQYVNCKGGSAANVASPQNTDIYYTTTKLGETQTIASKTSGTSGSTIDIYNYPVYALGYYTSFRVIVKNTFGNSYGLTTDANYTGREVGIGQWNIKFTPHIINPYKYRLGNSSLNLQASYSEFLTIPTIQTLGTDGISFSLWVSTDGSQEGSQIMELGNGYNNNNILMYISNGNLYFGINNGNSSNTISHDSMIATKILDGNWRNIVVLISTDGTWTFYVNGQFVKTVAGVYPADVPRYINYLGKSSLKMDPYFNGYIDDFRVYRTVLTTTEIAEIYNSTSTSALDANGLTGFEYNGIDFSKLYKRKYTESAGIITTIAGGGTSRGDGGLATSASFGPIYDIALDNSNNYIYFSLVDGNYVRRIDASGIITTIVGTGVKNSSGDGGLAVNASVNAPSGLALDSSMNLYIAERDGNRIRKIDIPNGTIRTIAGTMQPIATTTTDTPGNTVSNWVVSDISFTASMSAIAVNDSRYKAGHGFIYGTHGLDTGVHFELNTYSSTTGVYSGTRNTTGVIGVPGLTANTLSGDWLQLYSSQPVRMISYNLSSYYYFIGLNIALRMPQSYYILGSNNGTAWDPIQKVDCSYMSVDAHSICPTFTYNVTTNYGVQQIGPNPIPNSIGYGAYLNYSYADNSYNFFRISFQRTFGQNGGGSGTGAPLGWGNPINIWNGNSIAIGKWAINFQADCSGTKGSYGDGMLAIGSAINTPQGIRIDSSNNIYISEAGGNRIRKIDASSGIITSIMGYISPNSASATTKNWLANGTMWDASASSFRTSSNNFPYLAFNTGAGTDATTYCSATGRYSATAGITLGKYTGTVNTSVIYNTGRQTVSGEWLQIHSGTPCQFISHRLSAWTGDTNRIGTGLPASYLIAGSMDASSWYPIQDVSCGWASVDDTTTPGSTEIYVASTISSTIRYGTPNTKGDVYLTGYPTTANYYTYFRLIGREIFNQRFGFTLSPNWGELFISEWNINFLGGGGYGGASAATASSTGDLSLNGTIIGGIAGNATMNYPWGLAFDTSRNLYVAENGGHRIRKLLTDPSGTISSMSPITTICGNGTMSHTGDGRFAINATIGKPIGIDIDTSNNILLGFDDSQVTAGSVIRMINGNNGIIDKVAGTGSSEYSGDGGFATQALLWNPYIARFDKNRNIYIGDASNGRIRKITRLTAPPATNLLRNGVDIANTFSPKTGITTTQLINGIYNTNLQDNIEPIEQQAIPAKGRVFTDNNSWVVPANPVYVSDVSLSIEILTKIYKTVYPPLNKVINVDTTTTLNNESYGNGTYNVTLSEYSTTGLGPLYVDNTSSTTIFDNRWQPRPYNTTYSTVNGSTIYSLNTTNTTTVSGISYNGHWLQIEFPYKIKVNSYSFITKIDYGSNNVIYNFVLAGSNDNTNWTLVDNNNVTDYSYQKILFYNINPITEYKTYRFIIITAFDTYPVLSQLQFYDYRIELTNTVSASNTTNGFNIYKAFNTTLTDANDAWSSTTNLYDTTTGNYISNTYTYINGIGNVGGEWLQVQTSLPLSMNNYQLKSRISGNGNALSRRYYIVGSNDKLTWYPIQYVNRNSNNNGIIGTTTTYTVDTRTNYIDNKTGDSGENVNSDVTGYSTSSDYYTYFRIITTENCSTSSSQASSVSIGEWTIAGTVLTNPTGWQFSASSEDASMNANAFNAFNNSTTAFWKDICGNYNSNSGNYCDIVSPNSTAATGYSWTANGIAWDASSSSFHSSPYAPFYAFNATNGAANNSWNSSPTPATLSYDDGATTTTPGRYLGTTKTSVVGFPLGISGEWIQVKSNKPCQYLMHNIVSFDDGGNLVGRALPARYYIVGSTDGSTWYPIQDISYAYSATDNLSAAQRTPTFSMTTNTTPTYYGATGTIGYVNLAGYSTSNNYYTFFRMIVKEIFGKRYLYPAQTYHSVYMSEWNLTLRQGSITSTPFTNTIGNPYSSYRFPVPYKPTTILQAFGSPIQISATDTKMILLSYGSNTTNTSPLYSTYSNNTWTTPTLFGDGTAKTYLGLAMNSEGTRIAMCGDLSSVFIYSWTTTTPTLIQTIYSGYSTEIRDCAMSGDGNRLVISANGAIRFALWNNALNRYSEFRNTLENKVLMYYGIDISKDGNKIVYQHNESTFANQRIYWATWNGSNYTNGTVIGAPGDTTTGIRRVKFNNDASVIYNSLSSSSSSNIYISYYDYLSNSYSAFNTTNSIPRNIASSGFDCWGVNVSNDGKYLYVLNHLNTTKETRTIFRLELAPTNIAEGEWIQVKLPYQLKATNYSIMNRPTTAEKDDLYNEPRIWWLLGSNDGSAWNLVDYRNDTASIGGAMRKFNVNTKDYYSYYRLVISATSATTTTTSATLAQLFLNGIYNYTDSVITTIGTNYGNVEQILPIPGFNPTSNNFTYNGRSFITSSSSQTNSTNPPFNAFKNINSSGYVKENNDYLWHCGYSSVSTNNTGTSLGYSQSPYDSATGIYRGGMTGSTMTSPSSTNFWRTNFYGGNESNTVAAATMTSSTYTVPRANIIGLSITADNTRVVYCVHNIASQGLYFATLNSDGTWSGETSFYSTLIDCRNLTISADGSRGVFNELNNGIYYFTWTGSTYTTPIKIESKYNRTPHGIKMTPDGNRIITLSTNATSVIHFSQWNGTSFGPLTQILETRSLQYVGLGLSNDGNRLIYGTEGEVNPLYNYNNVFYSVWNGTNYTNGKQILDTSSKRWRNFEFSIDNNILYASTTANTTATLWVSKYNSIQDNYEPFIAVPALTIPANLDAWPLFMSRDGNTLYCKDYASTTLYRMSTQIYQAAGEWIQAQSSSPLKLTNYRILNKQASTNIFDNTRAPIIFFMLGSNDGSTWYLLDAQSITTTPTTRELGSYSTSTTYATQYYTYFRLVVNKVSGNGDVVNLTNVQLFGVYL